MDGCLTLDIGNTNASLAFVSFVDGGALRTPASRARAAQDWAPQGATVEPLGAWSREDDEIERLAVALRQEGGRRASLAAATGRAHAGISAVGSHERERRLMEVLTGFGWEVLARPDAGLRLEIDHPETCGTDRQYAMRAALEDQRWLSRVSVDGPVHVLVIDAGTALTVDAGRLLLASAEDASPGFAFLGGAIAMGPGSLAAAITARGARLAEFEIDPAAHALGRSTVEALRAGVSVGFRGAVRELASSVSQEAFGGTVDVVAYLTGGARAYAREAVAGCFPAGFHESAHLVHVGLARAVRSAASAT